MAFKQPVPERFGEIGSLHGLMISCAGCTRGTAFERDELVRRFGEEGRVAEIVRRFRCSNCASKRQARRPGVRVELIKLVKSGVTEGERARAKLTPVDRLVFDIARLKPNASVS